MNCVRKVTNLGSYQIVRCQRGSIFAIIGSNVMRSPVVEVATYLGVFWVIRNSHNLSFSPIWAISVLILIKYLLKPKMTFKHLKRSVDCKQLYMILRRMNWHKYTGVEIEKMWLNRIIRDLWPYFRQFLQSSLLHYPLGWWVSIETIDLGNEPICISAIQNVDSVDQNGPVIIYDVHFNFSGKSDMKLQVNIFNCLPAGITSLNLQGRARVVMELDKFTSRGLPHIRTITLTFVECPLIIYCKAIGICKWYSIFSDLEEFVARLFKTYLVLPRSILVEFVQEICSLQEAKILDANAIVKIDLLFANGLSPIGTDALLERRPNCFCTVKIGDSKKQISKTIVDCEDPVWNESYTFPVHTSKLDLQIELYDALKESDELIHRFEYEDIEEIFGTLGRNGKENIATMLIGAKQALFTFRVSIFELHEIRADLKRIRTLCNWRLPAGVVAVLVDTAYGVQNLPTHNPLYSQLLQTFVKVNLGHQTKRTEVSCKLGNNPYWGKAFSFLCYQPSIENLIFEVYGKAGEIDHLLGSCIVPINRILSHESLHYQDQIYLDGLAKDAHLNVYIIYKPAAPQKGFFGTYKASIERVIQMIQQMKTSKLKMSEEEEEQQNKRLFAEPKAPGFVGATVADARIRVLLKLGWQRSKDFGHSRFFVDVIQVADVPPISVAALGACIALELFDGDVLLEKRLTTTKAVTSHPTYHERKLFENVDAQRTEDYKFKILLLIKLQGHALATPFAEKWIQFPQQLQSGTGCIQHWFSLDVVRHIESLGGEEALSDDDSVEYSEIDTLMRPPEVQDRHRYPAKNTLDRLLNLLRISTTADSKKLE